MRVKHFKNLKDMLDWQQEYPAYKVAEEVCLVRRTGQSSYVKEKIQALVQFQFDIAEIICLFKSNLDKEGGEE